VIAGGGGCSTKAVAPPTKDPTPPAMTSVVVADADAPPPPPPPALPVYAHEPFAPAGSAPRAVFAIDGGLVVAETTRVGKVVGDGIAWLGKIPKTTPGIADNIIVSVHGRLPDAVGAIYETLQGRAPSPTYVAITGKAATHTEAPGGGWGLLYATQVGDSTVLAGGSGFDGFHLITVRGPKLPRRLTSASTRCKPDEIFRPGLAPEANPAVQPSAFEATSEGTMVSLGTLCEKHGPVAEIWDKTTGASSLVELGAWWPRTSFRATLLRGSGDELWAFSDPFHPVLHYAGGKFEPLPLLEAPIESIFVSASGQIQAYASTKTLYRFADGKWTAFGRTAEPIPERGTVVMDSSGALWSGANDKVYRLHETSRAPATEPCATWFVYLYESRNNGTNYGYPTTRKALSSFSEAADIGLVEFGSYPRHLGVTVKSRAQGEAVVAHVRATMKDEAPRLFCYQPEKVRNIP
jgi:hypothetical protein